MEAPSISNQYEKPENIIFQHKVNLNSKEGTNYEVLIYVQGNNLKIDAKTLTKSQITIYKQIFTFDLIIKNRYFLICENIIDIFNELIKLITKSQNENDKSYIIEEKENIILRIPLPTEKIKEALFKLNLFIDYEKKNNNNANNNEELYNIINDLKKEIENLKEENKNYQIKQASLFSELKSFFREEIEKLQNGKNNNFITPKKNDIEIKKDLELINKWIDPSKKLNFKLIFQKTKNGNLTEDFHKYCDNKGSTIIIIETNNKIKFGAFLNENWNSNEEWKKNIKDFVFSLNLKKKFMSSGEGHTMFCHSNYILIGDCNGEIKFENTLDAGTTEDDIFNTEGILNFENKFFITQEIEVYQVQE